MVLTSLKLVSSLRSVPLSDGGTVIAGEITKQPYKPLRGECRVSGVTVAFYYNHLPRRFGARYSPRPLIGEGGS